MIKNCGTYINSIPKQNFCGEAMQSCCSKAIDSLVSKIVGDQIVKSNYDKTQKQLQDRIAFLEMEIDRLNTTISTFNDAASVYEDRIKDLKATFRVYFDEGRAREDAQKTAISSLQAEILKKDEIIAILNEIREIYHIHQPVIDAAFNWANHTGDYNKLVDAVSTATISLFNYQNKEKPYNSKG